MRFALELGCAGDVKVISAEALTRSRELFLLGGWTRGFCPVCSRHATVPVPVELKNAARRLLREGARCAMRYALSTAVRCTNLDCYSL